MTAANRPGLVEARCTSAKRPTNASPSAGAVKLKPRASPVLDISLIWTFVVIVSLSRHRRESASATLGTW